MESSEKLTKRLSILRELRTVTGTMRGLSAVNIRHFEKAALSVSEHDAVVDLGFQALAIAAREALPRLTTSIQSSQRIVILFGTDHGLCGRFNERVVDHGLACEFFESFKSGQTHNQQLDTPQKSGSCRLLIVGHVLAELCAMHKLDVFKVFSLPGSVEGIPDLVRKLIIDIDMYDRENKNIQIDILHTRTEKDTGIAVAQTSLLPIKRYTRTKSNEWPTHNLPAITLPPETLLASLIREHIFIGLYRSCAESQAAEYLSRLNSMQAACQNIDDQISNVDHRLRRHRQANITNELLDTVSGYETIMAQNKRL